MSCLFYKVVMWKSGFGEMLEPGEIFLSMMGISTSMATIDGYLVRPAGHACAGQVVRWRGPAGTGYLGVYQQPLSCTVTNYCDSIHHNPTRAPDSVASPRTGFVDHAPHPRIRELQLAAHGTGGGATASYVVIKAERKCLN